MAVSFCAIFAASAFPVSWAAPSPAATMHDAPMKHSTRRILTIVDQTYRVLSSRLVRGCRRGCRGLGGCGDLPGAGEQVELSPFHVFVEDAEPRALAQIQHAIDGGVRLLNLARVVDRRIVHLLHLGRHRR